MKVYGFLQSGNCYKIKLLSSLLGLNVEWNEVDMMAGYTKTSEFLEKNPNGKIPLLELDDGRFLSESNAIINYLAAGSSLLPSDTYALAKVQQWQFFEQYSHEPFIAVNRFIQKFAGMPKEREEEYAKNQPGGYKALDVMELQLSETNFIAGSEFTTADVSLYAYTHVAHEGGFVLDEYPGIESWLARVESQENFVGMNA